MVTIIQYGNLPKQKLLEKVPALHIFTVEGVHPNHSITSTMQNPIKNTQLIVSVAVVIPVSFGYGLVPSATLPYLFDFQVETTDLHNIFRAVMGLYLANAALWVLGIFNPRFWETATFANVFFMGGLALGRLLSLLVDGIGSPIFALGMLAEAGMAIWGVLNLRQMRRQGIQHH